LEPIDESFDAILLRWQKPLLFLRLLLTNDVGAALLRRR
jgi:hypothetical protein